ncbi:MAG: glycosyltransferase, partial [Tepidisphaeraceae bacterium]
MNVSVIIPAHNSAETVEETLRSLVAQTWPHWEAIVIDDGSTDATATLVRRFIETEPRVRLIEQPKSGVSAARNNGIDQIRTDWMCFLDADDIFLPDYFQKMTDALAADPTLDAVTCGWARLLPDGSRFDFNNRPPGIDLFEALAHDCVITIHTVVIKVDIVRRAGKFDTSLRTCEDWDLWQRIARCGCRFGRLDDTLCLYRTRPGSASFDASRLIQDSLVVVRRAHEPDPRVTDPDPRHANGITKPVPLVKQWYHLCWFASLALGRGQESSHLVSFLADRPAPELEAAAVGIIIADGMLLPALTPPHRAYQLWPKVEGVIESFLREVGRVNGVGEFAEQALRAIDREILYRTEAVRSTTVGRTALRVLDVCSPIEDLTLPAPIERVRIRVELDGKKLDELTLPVVAGIVPADVIADAMADRCFWPILGAYFAKTIYPTLRVERDGETASLFRGTFPLAGKLPAADPFAGEAVHAAADWTLMLQELFGRPNWPSDRFYDPNFVEEWRGSKVSCNAGRVTIELSRELPDVRTPMPLLQVMPTVGGAPLGVVPIKVSNGLVKAQQIRSAVICSTGVDLCRAIVR